MLSINQWIIVFSCFFLFSCNSKVNSERTQIIEEAVLWKAEINQNWLSPKFKQLSENISLFEAEGNFFKAKLDIKAFNHEITYIGLMGINRAMGPNVYLKGDPVDVVTYINVKYNIEFDEYKETLFIS